MGAVSAQRFTNRMGLTFRWVGWVWLVFCAGTAFTIGQVPLGTVRGVTIAALVVAYALWFGLSDRLLGPIRFGMPIWRAALYLLVLLGLSLALTSESIYFVATVWMLFGIIFGTFRLRIAVPLGIASGLLAARMSGMLPANMLSGDGLYQLGLTLLILLMWIIMAVLLQHLVSVRFANGRLIEQLKAAQDGLARQAQAEQENAVLRERTRLAREVHDGVGHALTLIAVKAEAAQRLMAIDSGRAHTELDQIKTVARNGMQDLHQSVASLRAPLGGQPPFEQSIRDYAAELAATAGWRLTLDLPVDGLPPLRRDVEEAVWRTLQEALTNVLRHASAGHVTIVLTADAAGLILTVQDDGRGICDGLTATTHFGLRGLNERAEILGGKLIVEARTGGGTTLTLALPRSEHATRETADAHTLTAV